MKHTANSGGLNHIPHQKPDPVKLRSDDPTGARRGTVPENKQSRRVATLLVINGPNLNLLGRREPGIYGSQTLQQIEELLARKAQEMNIRLEFFQSNIEGELVDEIQRADQAADGVLLNAGGYTHTSIAIRDAVAGISVPVVEVHLSNIQAREDFRRRSLLADVCAGSIAGFGADSYMVALLWFKYRMDRQIGAESGSKVIEPANNLDSRAEG